MCLASPSLLLQLGKCRMLVEIARNLLEEGNNPYYGIEACSEVLDGRVSGIGPMLRHECLCIRAALLLKVPWKLFCVRCRYLSFLRMNKFLMSHLLLFYSGSGKMMSIWP